MHWRRKWQPSPVFLPGESQGQGSLVGCCLWSRRDGHNWSDLAAAAFMSIRNSQSFPPPYPSHLETIVHSQILWVYFCFVNKLTCTIFFLLQHICNVMQYCLTSVLSSLWLTSLSVIVSRSIHVTAKSSISFFSMAEQYSTVCMYHIIFIHHLLTEM